MKKKLLNCLGMMSGTSMDGVDISLIKTDGENFFESIIDKYYEFPDNLYNRLIKIREIINFHPQFENLFYFLENGKLFDHENQQHQSQN